MGRKSGIVAARPVSDLYKEPSIGTVLSKPYKILQKIGEGGFGIVFLALDLETRKRVAIKHLHVQDVPGMKERFEREATVMRLVKHKYVIGFLDYFHDPAFGHFLVMDYVSGDRLDELIDEHHDAGEQLDLSFILDVMEQLLIAVGFVHEKGIVHRDLKAENVMVVQLDGMLEVKLGDFGIAKVLGGGGEPGLHARLTSRFLKMNQLCIFGSPESMAPEQIKMAAGGGISPATDIYALGVLLYFMLTGELPFSAEKFAENETLSILEKHLNVPPPDVREKRKDAPEKLALAIMKAMAKDPQDRFPSADEFLDVIKDVQRDFSPEGQDVPEPEETERPQSEPPPVEEKLDEPVPEPMPAQEPLPPDEPAAPEATEEPQAIAEILPSERVDAHAPTVAVFAAAPMEYDMRLRRRLATLVAIVAAIIILIIVYVSYIHH